MKNCKVGRLINCCEKLQSLEPKATEKLRRLLLKIQDKRLCTVCMDELISSVFCPCGHYVAYSKCSMRLDRCPVCSRADNQWTMCSMSTQGSRHRLLSACVCYLLYMTTLPRSGAGILFYLQWKMLDFFERK